MGRSPGFDGAAKAVPARQHQPTLRPAKHARDRPQILDLRRGFARGGAAADIEIGDLADHRRVAEEAAQAFDFINKFALGAVRCGRQRVHYWTAIAQILNGLEQRHDIDGEGTVARLQRPAPLREWVTARRLCAWSAARNTVPVTKGLPSRSLPIRLPLRRKDGRPSGRSTLRSLSSSSRSA
jgi:hypothetical protein